MNKFAAVLVALSAIPTLSAQVKPEQEAAAHSASASMPPLACMIGMQQVPETPLFPELVSLMNGLVSLFLPPSTNDESSPNGPPIGPTATWWFCAYWDSVVVFNSFHSSRTYTEVRNYFYGYPNSHDCHAWYRLNGRTYQWCTYAAQPFARAHGGIYRIGRA